MQTITIHELETAINRARAAQPATGSHASLSADVALLADVYGGMIYGRRDSVVLEELSLAQREVVGRWMDLGAGGGKAGQAPPGS